MFTLLGPTILQPLWLSDLEYILGDKYWCIDSHNHVSKWS